MAIIARVDDVEITSDDLVRYLKINEKFDQLLEDMITERLTTAEAPRMNITASDEEVQAESDTVRRTLGLHRSQDTLDFLDGIGLSVEGFERSLRDNLLRKKVIDRVCSEQVIKDFFALHSPKFESVEISQIVVNSEGKARELMAVLEEDPEEFGAMARAYSLDPETADRGGNIGLVARGGLNGEVEAKVFNGAVGQVLGPFESEDGSLFELFMVTRRHKPKLDESTRKMIAKIVYDKWLDERIEEHKVEIL